MELKNLVHSKPFMKIIGILLLIVRLGKSSHQTIIQIIRENKSILLILFNVSHHRNVSKTIPTFKMKVFVVILVCGLQLSTIVTNNSILGIAKVLDVPRELYNMF